MDWNEFWEVQTMDCDQCCCPQVVGLDTVNLNDRGIITWFVVIVGVGCCFV